MKNIQAAAPRLDYRAWILQQLRTMEAEFTRDAGLNPETAVYFIPATATEHGRVTVAAERPIGALPDPLQFSYCAGRTAKLGFVPRQHWEMGLHDACRELPVYPCA